MSTKNCIRLSSLTARVTLVIHGDQQTAIVGAQIHNRQQRPKAAVVFARFLAVSVHFSPSAMALPGPKLAQLRAWGGANLALNGDENPSLQGVGGWSKGAVPAGEAP